MGYDTLVLYVLSVLCVLRVCCVLFEVSHVSYGVATVSRIDKIIDLICKRDL